MSSCVSIDEQARRDFEAAWRAGRPKPIEDCLPSADRPHYLATLEELVHIELEFLWQPGDTTQASADRTRAHGLRVEHYLQRFPRLNRPEVIKRLAHQEYRARCRSGDNPSPREYESRFPGVICGSDFGTPAVELADAGPEPGEQLGRYRLVAEHARGGFGVVWRADDGDLGREVALKQLSGRLSGQRNLRERFVTEARIAAQLEHPGVVPVYEIGAKEGQAPYYTMKFVRGQTLTEAILRYHEEPKSPGEHVLGQLRLLNTFLAVTRAVAYAHAKGVIHRDLKPDNIILGDYGETVILDWGLAKVLGQKSPAEDAEAAAEVPVNLGLTMAGTVLGTPAYMSPEQAAGRNEEVDQRSDIYALGAILYQVLTGRRPYQGHSSDEVLRQVLTVEPPKPRAIDPHVSRALEAICRKAMAKRAADRYAEAAQLSQDIERFLADEPVSAYREPWTARAGRWRRRHRTAVVSAAVAVLLAIIGAAGTFWVWQRSEQRLQREAEQHLAKLQSAAESSEALAIAELQKNQFSSAADILEQAIDGLEEEPQLADLHARLQARCGRAARLKEFYRLADRAERLGFYERDDETVALLEAALSQLGVFDRAPWWEALPGEDLTEAQQQRLKEDVYFQLAFLSAMRAKGGLVNFGRPAAAKAYRSALKSVALMQQMRPSQSARVLEVFCRLGLGEAGKISAPKVPEPSSATDCFFLGIAHFWIHLAGKDISEATQDPVAAFALGAAKPLLGMDFQEPLATAERLLREGARREPQHYWTHFWLGWTLLAAGDARGAELALDTCTALRPHYALGYAYRGIALLHQANCAQPPPKPRVKQELLSRSARDFGLALKYEPDDYTIWWLYLDLIGDRYAEALAAFQRVIDLQPPLQTWQGRRGYDENKFMLERAKQYALQLTQKDPNNADAWTVAASACLALGEEQPAQRHALRCLELPGDHHHALAVRGWVRLRQRHDELAVKDFQRALTAKPRCWLAATGQAELCERAGRDTEILAAYDRLMGIAKTDWQKVAACLERARTLRRMGREDEADRALAEARQINPCASVEQPEALRQSRRVGAKTVPIQPSP